MTHEYTSIVHWSEKEDEHGSITMDCGYACGFHKPVEFGGSEGMMNPEDAFVGSLAMCYSITLESTLEKMRLELEDFELKTKGVLEDTEEGSRITKIDLIPKVKLKNEDDKNKVERALKLAKKNCLISKSMSSEIELKPEIE
ncbi:MAG: OsmC family protein [Candidatus Thermoplasmatota archaeon]|nr:OsmC family protein [Candidatus Thermoplasmatota archaeon]MBS3790382.1 OsmC family protein [Candidatus Thermoplasmatota archaeon]